MSYSKQKVTKSQYRPLIPGRPFSTKKKKETKTEKEAKTEKPISDSDLAALENLFAPEMNSSVSSRLKDQGIFYLCGDIEENTCKSISEELLCLHFDPNWDNEAVLMINSYGGSLCDAYALIDIMDFVRFPVNTIALGTACSAGLMIAIAGTKGKRGCAPNTELMSHRFTTGVHGNHSDLIASQKMVDILHGTTIRHYIRCSKYKTQVQIEKHLLKETDVWLTPEEALTHGLFDYIGTIGPE